MQYLNITQGVGEGTHVDSNAIDSAGLNGGIENVYAPYDGVIKKIYGTTVWLESLEPVEWADGSVDFATSMYVHDNSVADLFVGKVIRQGEAFYQEGTAGQATGNHCHMEIGRGKFTGSGWYLNSGGYWTLNNTEQPWKAFFLNGTIVINGYGYPWKEAQTMSLTTLFEERVLSYFIGGRNGLDGSQNALNGEVDEELIKNHVGAETNAAIAGWYNSDEGQHWLNIRFPAIYSKAALANQLTTQVNDINKLVTQKNDQILTLTNQLLEKPKEIVKEVVVTKEVVKSDADRSVGDLLSAAFAKLFHIK